MAKSKNGESPATNGRSATDPNSSPYAGIIAEIDEHMAIIRNRESDDGSVQRAEKYLRNLMQTTRFKMALSNYQIRLALSNKLPF